MDPQLIHTSADGVVVESCLQIMKAMHDIFKTPWTEENDLELSIHFSILDKLRAELYRRQRENITINPPPTIFQSLRLIKQIDEITLLCKSWFDTKKDDKKSHGSN